MKKAKDKKARYHSLYIHSYKAIGWKKKSLNWGKKQKKDYGRPWEEGYLLLPKNLRFKNFFNCFYSEMPRINYSEKSRYKQISFVPYVATRNNYQTINCFVASDKGFILRYSYYFIQQKWYFWSFLGRKFLEAISSTSKHYYLCYSINYTLMQCSNH